MADEKALTPQQAIKEALEKDLDTITPYLEQLLPYRGGVERFRQLTQLTILRTPNLLNCDRKSLLLAILWCAYKGLEPGVEDGCWILPFKVKGILTATPVPAYKGLIARAISTDSLKDVRAECVYEYDDFSYSLGLDPQLHHDPPKIGQNRGKLIGAYAVFVLPDGSKRFQSRLRLTLVGSCLSPQPSGR